jgi:transcriptional regulator GlxA family with amidase domain
MAHHGQIVAKAITLMNGDPAAGWTITRLAACCNTSPTVLKEAFRSEMGVPIGSWYRNLRMQRACQMMESSPNRSIASIAATLGYANPSKFSRAFRDCMGCPPSAWRKNRAEKA